MTTHIGALLRQRFKSIDSEIQLTRDEHTHREILGKNITFVGVRGDAFDRVAYEMTSAGKLKWRYKQRRCRECFTDSFRPAHENV